MFMGLRFDNSVIFIDSVLVDRYLGLMKIPTGVS
jgi:hypothetical protein